MLVTGPGASGVAPKRRVTDPQFYQKERTWWPGANNQNQNNSQKFKLDIMEISCLLAMRTEAES